eukprot:11022320-Lingulodinium_polyedra.AAC.1
MDHPSVASACIGSGGHSQLYACAPGSTCSLDWHASGSGLQHDSNAVGPSPFSDADYAEHLASQSVTPTHWQQCSCDPCIDT